LSRCLRWTTEIARCAGAELPVGVAGFGADWKEEDMASKHRKQIETVLVEALGKGATVAQAAEQAGVSERTVYRRLERPDFQAQIDALQDEMIQRAAAVLTAAAVESIRSLVALQDPATAPTVRRHAARDILEIGMRLREAADWEKRLAALETCSAAAVATSYLAGPNPSGPPAKRRPRGEATLLLNLACGSTVSQAAAQAKISERTVYRRLKDAEFHQRIEALRADMVKRAAARLIAAALLATKTLVDLQSSTTPAHVRRRAARDILELSQKLRRATVIEKRLLALEKVSQPDAATG
jgi:transposase